MHTQSKRHWHKLKIITTVIQVTKLPLENTRRKITTWYSRACLSACMTEHKKKALPCWHHNCACACKPSCTSSPSTHWHIPFLIFWLTTSKPRAQTSTYLGNLVKRLHSMFNRCNYPIHALILYSHHQHVQAHTHPHAHTHTHSLFINVNSRIISNLKFISWVSLEKGKQNA